MFARLFLAAAVLSLPLGSQSIAAQTVQEGPQHVRVLVRAEASTQLDRNNIAVKVDGKPVQVTSFHPILSTNEPVELVIALDDGLRGNFANSLSNIRSLVQTLPPNIAVTVGYMQNGRVVMPAEGFSGGREAAIRELRIPRGQFGSSASPYFCIEDLSKNWPSKSNAARMMLVITNGIDPYNGAPTPMNQNSPYVDNATVAAQRARVAVYTIFWSSFGVSPGYGGFSGENYLQQVSEGTGGDLLSNGTMNPPDVSPFLKRFEKALQQTYIASFDTPLKSKDLSELKISTDVSHVKLHAPKAIGVQK